MQTIVFDKLKIGTTFKTNTAIEAIQTLYKTHLISKNDCISLLDRLKGLEKYMIVIKK